MSDWQPIETAPKDGTRVLCWNNEWPRPESGCLYGMNWAANSLAADKGGWKHQPTHWMPLPSPPGATALDRLSGRVTVKALSWEETQIARGDGTHEHDGGYEAVTPIGIYGIEMYFGSDSYGWEVRLDSVGKVADRDDPEAAKAAAQADFKSRILAAIDTAPAPSPDQIGREALREAVEKLEEGEMHYAANLVRSLITGGEDDAA